MRRLNAFFSLLLIGAVGTLYAETVTFQEGDGGAYSDTNDALGKEEYPTFNHADSAWMIAGGPSGSHRIAFVQFPDIVGA